MHRRSFITLLGGAAAAWPLAARAQQPMPVIGFLQGQSPATAKPLIEAFGRGLAQTGFVEGRNVVVEYRLANGQADRLPGLAAELVSQRVNVIASGYSAARAAKGATATIPIVFMGGADPVRAGLVASINRPGGNVTGVSLVTAELAGKRLGLLRELVPQVSVLGALLEARDSEGQLDQVIDAGRRLGMTVQVARVSSERDFEDAFAKLAREGAGAIIVTAATLFNNNSDRLVELAARHAVPTVYELREFVKAGGLMSYAPSLTDAFRQGGVYAGRVLKGDKPADLPVLLPVKFEFVLNLTTAKALGLTIPPGVLAITDEVIE